MARNPYLKEARSEIDFRQNPEQQFRSEKLRVMRMVMERLLPDRKQRWIEADRITYNAIQNELGRHDVSFDPLVRANEARQSWSHFVASGLAPGRKRLQDYLPLVQKVHLSGKVLQVGAVPDIPAPSGESTSVPPVEVASDLLDFSLLDFAAAGECTQQMLDDESAIAAWTFSVLMNASDRSIENAILNSDQESNVGILNAEDTNQCSGDLMMTAPKAIAKVQIVGDCEPDIVVMHPLTAAGHRAAQDDPTAPLEKYCWGLTPVLTASCPQNRAIILNSPSVQITCGLRDTIRVAKDWQAGGVLVVFNARRSVSVVRPRGISIIDLGGS
jgi:hypothetical protein